jgi:uncharacterized DUF497 family protein
MYDWDEAKRAANLAKHRVDFVDMERFDWGTALTREDARRDYGETRFISVGLIDGRLHVCVWTPRHQRLRIVTLRKANRRERLLDERETSIH